MGWCCCATSGTTGRCGGDGATVVAADPSGTGSTPPAHLAWLGRGPGPQETCLDGDVMDVFGASGYSNGVKTGPLCCGDKSALPPWSSWWIKNYGSLQPSPVAAFPCVALGSNATAALSLSRVAHFFPQVLVLLVYSTVYCCVEMTRVLLIHGWRHHSPSLQSSMTVLRGLPSFSVASNLSSIAAAQPQARAMAWY